jgi:transcriptional regulator with XRE-family HTH domain
MVPKAGAVGLSYDANMPRKREKPAPAPVGPDWFLPEWMASLEVSQADLARECGWTNSTMHGIYHGRTAYYREIVNLIAEKLNLRPYELLMHPDEANAIRQIQREALRVVEIGEPLREGGNRAAR